MKHEVKLGSWYTSMSLDGIEIGMVVTDGDETRIKLDDDWELSLDELDAIMKHVKKEVKNA